MYKIFIALGSICYSAISLAFPCNFTLVKDSCWINYDVTVTVINSQTKEELTTTTAPKGQSWIRIPFNCEAGQVLTFDATFEPVFWESDKGKHYSTQKYWQLPATINENDKAWNITLCYPERFSQVPLPPDVSGSCTCDLSKIPPLAPS